jgi:multidrug efflux pump subunit AcrB
LAEAIILVALVVFLFLGKLRTRLIPLVAVPVSLVGTFAVMLAIGYSANTVSLLALVLAIGIVVDDVAERQDVRSEASCVLCSLIRFSACPRAQ